MHVIDIYVLFLLLQQNVVIQSLIIYLVLVVHKVMYITHNVQISLHFPHSQQQIVNMKVLMKNNVVMQLNVMIMQQLKNFSKRVFHHHMLIRLGILYYI
eukprot:UN00139